MPVKIFMQLNPYLQRSCQYKMQRKYLLLKPLWHRVCRHLLTSWCRYLDEDHLNWEKAEEESVAVAEISGNQTWSSRTLGDLYGLMSYNAFTQIIVISSLFTCLFPYLPSTSWHSNRFVPPVIHTSPMGINTCATCLLPQLSCESVRGSTIKHIGGSTDVECRETSGEL